VFTQSILFIYIKSGSSNIAFEIIKKLKTKFFEGSNDSISIKDPVSSPSLVRVEKIFRENKLEKDEETEIRIISFKYLQGRLDVMTSWMTDNEVIISLMNL
jgi:SepF-like predicted cell division protein (DUF552 family)